MISHPEKVSEILEEVAKSEVMPRFRSLKEGDIQEKEHGDLVTVADVAAEKAIAPLLQDLVPGSLVVGEEAVAADPSLLKSLESDKPVWLIDPIDGTGNFAKGHPCFVVMVALVRAGEILAGWIHDPIAGETAAAMKGAGAERAGKRLKVVKDDDPRALHGALHAGTFATPEMKALIKARRIHLNTLHTLGSAGQEYLRLSAGEAGFTLFTKLMPWDHAPGAVIHSEAGGIGLTLDGVAYRPIMHRSPALLIAPGQTAWDWLNKTLFEGADPSELTAWHGNYDL